METIGPLNRAVGAYQPPVTNYDKLQPKQEVGSSYSRLQYQDLKFQSETIHISDQGREQAQRSVSVNTSTTTATFARVAPANNLDHPPESSANTIVNFIEQKLKQVAKEGGDKEALESVLSDGLIGYETGRDEALDILKGYGFLTDDIKAGIDKTTELVKAGLDELRSQYIEGNSPSADVAPATAIENSESKGGSVSTGVSLADAKNRLDNLASAIEVDPSNLRTAEPSQVSSFNQQIEQYQQQIANSQSFEFKVQTRDGDLVTLSLASASQSSESYSYKSASANGKESVAYTSSVSFSGSSDYQLTIDGNLDEDELAAIENLLADIGQLSQDFFQGDIQSAFEQAINIGFDTSELAAFTLNLSQSESVKVSSYQEQSSSNKASNPFVAQLAPIGERMTEIAQNAIESNQGLDYLALLEPVLAVALAFKAEEKQSQELSQQHPQESVLNQVDNLAADEGERVDSQSIKEPPRFGISPKSDYLFELLSIATLRQQMVLGTQGDAS